LLLIAGAGIEEQEAGTNKSRGHKSGGKGIEEVRTADDEDNVVLS
jgi:hypothetical protein